jgi:hypothetical protein
MSSSEIQTEIRNHVPAISYNSCHSVFRFISNSQVKIVKVTYYFYIHTYVISGNSAACRVVRSGSCDDVLGLLLSSSSCCFFVGCV